MLAQVALTDRTNEIGQMPDLLEQLALTGLVVTADAMHTQAATAQTILDADGDYLFVVKEDQPTPQHCDFFTSLARGHQYRRRLTQIPGSTGSGFHYTRYLRPRMNSLCALPILTNLI
ncbi:MAG: hypothetical protein ACKVZH_07435 [Blastocatellia bacterium]